MKRSAVYVVLLIIVVIIVAVLCVRIFTRDTAPEPPAEQQAETLPPEAAPEILPETPAPPTEAPLPTEAPEETEKPFETRPPIETELPETPEPAFEADGSFRSDTGTYLNLVAEWAASNDGGDTVTLQVLLSAESYSFYTSALYNSLQLTVNGTTYSANSPEVSYDGSDLARTKLAAFTVEVPRGTTTLEAVWHYKGSYSGVELTDITATTTVTLG